MSEKTINNSKKTFLGYYLPNDSIVLSMISIFGAVIFVLTWITAFPLPATEGIINIGDIGIMISGILFGPVIGGLAGGIGPAIADIIVAPIYVPATLIIKSLEGFVIGIIANPRKNYEKLNYRDVVAVILGGAIMIFGYLIYEIILYGIPSALLEFFLNVGIQFGLGFTGAMIFAYTARKNIIDGLPNVFDKIFIVETSQ